MSIKISDLPTATTFSGADLVPIVQDGITKRIAANASWQLNITGGNITANALTSGTVPSARISGNYTGIDRTAAVFSHPTTTGSVTTTHNCAVAASEDSTASGNRTMVLATLEGTASDRESAVIACFDGNAINRRTAVIASAASTANARQSAVIGSSVCETSGEDSAVVASLSSESSGTRSAVVASLSSETSGDRSAVVASDDSTASGPRSAVVAGVGSTATGNESAIVTSGASTATGNRSTIVASRRTANNTAFSLALGDATSGDASTANRKIHLFSTDGNVSIAGTLTQNATFTDFAEFMPNATGAEIEAGTLLTLDDGAVRPADEGEDICGVVSHTAAILAGDTPFSWQGRYLHDEFGRRLYEDIPDEDWEAEIPDPDWEPTEDDQERPMIPNPEPQGTVTVLKENPDWNPELPQVPRNERPDEWTPVGLLGQVFVRTGEQVQAGDRITAKGGKGYATTERTGLKVMQVTKDFDGNYGIARCLINVMV